MDDAAGLLKRLEQSPKLREALDAIRGADVVALRALLDAVAADIAAGTVSGTDSATLTETGTVDVNLVPKTVHGKATSTGTGSVHAVATVYAPTIIVEPPATPDVRRDLHFAVSAVYYAVALAAFGGAMKAGQVEAAWGFLLAVLVLVREDLK